MKYVISVKMHILLFLNRLNIFKVSNTVNINRYNQVDKQNLYRVLNN